MGGGGSLLSWALLDARARWAALPSGRRLPGTVPRSEFRVLQDGPGGQWTERQPQTEGPGSIPVEGTHLGYKLDPWPRPGCVWEATSRCVSHIHVCLSLPFLSLQGDILGEDEHPQRCTWRGHPPKPGGEAFSPTRQCGTLCVCSRSQPHGTRQSGRCRHTDTPLCQARAQTCGRLWELKTTPARAQELRLSAARDLMEENGPRVVCSVG